MKDFAKSIVCNTKAETAKVGNAPYKGAKPNYNGVSDSELKSWLRMAEQDLKNAKRDMDKANHDYRGAEITERDKVVGKYAEQINEANRVIYNITEELKERERNKHGNTRTGNSNKAEIIDKKKKEGATLKVDNGQKLEFSDGSTYVKTSFSDDYREAHNYTGNTRTGNINYSGIKEFKSESELRRWCMDHNYTYTPTHGGYYRLEDDKPGSHRSNLEAHVRQGQETGNTKIGNANTHLTASNSGELWLNFDGTGEMYDPIELGRYDFSGKSEALSVARELEQLKRKAEQKVKDADKFINAIKQWAAGLK